MPFVFRSALQWAAGSVAAVVATMRGWASEVDWGEWKTGEKAPVKITFQVRYYKQDAAALGRAVRKAGPGRRG